MYYIASLCLSLLPQIPSLLRNPLFPRTDILFPHLPQNTITKNFLGGFLILILRDHLLVSRITINNKFPNHSKHNENV